MFHITPTHTCVTGILWRMLLPSLLDPHRDPGHLLSSQGLPLSPPPCLCPAPSCWASLSSPAFLQFLIHKHRILYLEHPPHISPWQHPQPPGFSSSLSALGRPPSPSTSHIPLYHGSTGGIHVSFKHTSQPWTDTWGPVPRAERNRHKHMDNVNFLLTATRTNAWSKADG